MILLISLFLGLRHASDPDHLAAITTLIASEEERRQARKAGLMGFFWGLGHGTTLVILGLPLVLLNRFLPEPVQVVAETLIGVIIVALAVRLLLRWRRGAYHAHVHRHDEESPHRHVHSHKGGSQRVPQARACRSPPHAFGRLRHRSFARHRRLGWPDAAPALDHPQRGRGRGGAPDLRRRDRRLDGDTLDRLRSHHRRRSDPAQLRVRGAGTGRPEHGLRGLVRSRRPGSRDVPLLKIERL